MRDKRYKSPLPHLVLIYIFFTITLLITVSNAWSADSPLLYPIRSSVTGIGGFIDGQGRIQTQLWHEGPITFSEGLGSPYIDAPAPLGYIDTTGKYVIDKRFDYTHPFHEGLAAVEIGQYPDSRAGYIDKKGEMVIKPNFWPGSNFSGGLASIIVNGKWGFINTEGNIVINPRYEDAQDFSEGFAAVKIDGKWGYINRNGELVINPIYTRGFAFKNGMALIGLTSEDDSKVKYGYINSNGTAILPQYDGGGAFSEGLAPVSVHGTWSYIDKLGKIVIDGKFEKALSFREGLAAVKISGKYGYINTTGNIVIPPQFVAADGFNGPLAKVAFEIRETDLFYENGRFAYIDMTGKTVFRWSEGILYFQGTLASTVGPPDWVELEVKTRPAGAKLYLVPLLEWENKSKLLLSNKGVLDDYCVSDVVTNIKVSVEEKVYVAVLYLGTKRQIVKRVDAISGKKNRVEVIFR